MPTISLACPSRFKVALRYINSRLFSFAGFQLSGLEVFGHPEFDDAADQIQRQGGAQWESHRAFRTWVNGQLPGKGLDATRRRIEADMVFAGREREESKGSAACCLNMKLQAERPHHLENGGKLRVARR